MEQKIKDLRAKGLSLNEIAERLKIKRSMVESALSGTSVKVEKVAPAVTTSVKKATKKKTPAKRK